MIHKFLAVAVALAFVPAGCRKEHTPSPNTDADILSLAVPASGMVDQNTASSTFNQTVTLGSYAGKVLILYFADAT